VTVNPNVQQLASDLKTRILPWSHTNLGVVSEFYQDGQWHIGDENTAWYLSPCFAALAATLYRYDTTMSSAQKASYLQICVDTVNAAIMWNQGPAVTRTPVYVYNATPGYPGSLFLGLPSFSKAMVNYDGGPWGTPDPVGSDENGTIEVIATFCWILDELYMGGGIDASQAAVWLTSIKLAADWLIDFNGNPIWYTNGNYVSHELLAYGHLALICRKLGDEAGWERYSQAYEQTIQTLIYPFGNNTPASTQWAEYGYTVDVAGSGSSGTGTGPTHAAILTATGTTSDGSTETGHLTETPSHSVITPGVTNTFDGVYSQLQADLLATLYCVNRDYRVNYLLNAVTNKLDTITSYSTYLIDCTGGSRQTGIRGWTGGYQYVVGLLGRRSNNRTNLTNVNANAIWDQQLAANLTANGSNVIGQIQSSTARQYRIAIATALHACYLVAPRLT
jgi:hypothetical protein